MEMKSLYKFSPTPHLFLFNETLDGNEALSDGEKNENKELSEAQKKNLDKAQQRRIDEVIINQALDSIAVGKEDMEDVFAFVGKEESMLAVETGKNKIKSFPSGFEKVSASSFLKLSSEQLQQLFVSNGVVDFHGNNNALRNIGLVDLYPKTSVKQQYLRIDGETYAYGARRYDGKIGYGNPGYKPIMGGENIEFFCDQSTAETEMQKSYKEFASECAGFSGEMENLSPEEEKKEKIKFEQGVEKEEKREQEMLEEMDKALEGMEGVESMDRQDKYIATSKVYAEILEAKTGIPREVIIIQACLESGYGQSAIGGNHFGIKGKSSQKNTFQTTEYFTPDQFSNWRKNNPEMVSQATATPDLKTGKLKCSLPDQFRSYGSMRESFIDYGKYIKKPDAQGNPSGRYKEAFQYKNNPRKFLETVISCGYATDPNYMIKAAGIAERCGLEWG